MAAGQPFGLRLAGYRSIESLRLERGSRAWGSDIGPDTTPFEAGLGWAVDLYRKSLLKSAFDGRLTAEWRERNPEKIESAEALLVRIRGERERHYQAALNEWKRAVSGWEQGGKKGRKPTKPRQPANLAADCEPDHLSELTETNDNAKNLPKSWTVAKGADLTRFVRGVSYKKSEAQQQQEEGLTCVLRANNFGGDFMLDDLVFVPRSKITSEQFLKRDDLLFSMSSGSKSKVGKSILVRKDINASFGAFCGVLRPFNLKVSDWLSLAFSRRDFRKYVEDLAAGTNINNLKPQHLADYKFPFPPLEEQRRIVEILDTRLEAARSLETEIESALVRADSLRQSILKKAFAGKLVPQDPTDEPAQALLARIRARRDERLTAKPRKPTRQRANAGNPS